MPGATELRTVHNELRRGINDLTALERFFVHREDGATVTLGKRIAMDEGDTKFPLVGPKGCGKTTELLALVRSLEGTHFSVYISVLEEVHTSNITEGELLLIETLGLLSHAVGTGLDIGRKRSEDLASWLTAMSGGGEAEDGDGEPEPIELGRAVRTVRRGLKLMRAREEIAVWLERHHISLIERLNGLIRYLEKVDGRRVLLVIDDLDKMDEKPAAALFRDNHGRLNAPSCQCVLTVPYIFARSEGMRSVRDRYGRPQFLRVVPADDAGRAFMHDIVAKRARPGTVEADAVDGAIELSGGIPGDMLRILSEACVPANVCVARKDVDAAVNDLRSEARRHLSRDDMAVLSELLKMKGRVGSDVPSELVRDGYVIETPDDEGVLIPHPLIIPLLR